MIFIFRFIFRVQMSPRGQLKLIALMASTLMKSRGERYEDDPATLFCVLSSFCGFIRVNYEEVSLFVHIWPFLTRELSCMTVFIRRNYEEVSVFRSSWSNICPSSLFSCLDHHIKLFKPSNLMHYVLLRLINTLCVGY